MADTVHSRIQAQGLLSKVAVPDHIAALLKASTIATVGTTEKVTLGYTGRLGFLDLDLQPPNSPRDFVLAFEGPAASRTRFRYAVSLKEGPQAKIFSVVPDAIGRALVPAKIVNQGEKQRLEALNPAPKVTLKGAEVWLVIEGGASQVARMTVAPNVNGTGVVKLLLDPPVVLLGASGFGMDFSDGVSLDLDPNAKADGAIEPASALPWKGLVVPGARFFLPDGLPLMGGHPVSARLQVGIDPPGIALVVEATIPATPTRPKIDVRIECLDPTASGLGSFVPTLVEASMELPLDKPQQAGAATVKFLSGKPVVARARYARKPGGMPDAMEFSLALESTGSEGIVWIEGKDIAAKTVVSAATVGTALATQTADTDLAALLGAAAGGLSSFVQGGRFAVHRAGVAAAGRSAPTETMKFSVDYSVATQVQKLDIGVMSVQMSESQPLRMRVRDLNLSFNLGKPGLKFFDIDFSPSTMEVEDPGGWRTSRPDLLDILGTRSGRGSIWYEIDLGFRIDLGPVKLSRATVRAEVKKNQSGLTAQFSGVGAALDLAPLISGNGAVNFKKDGGFDVALGVNIDPLKVRAAGSVQKDAEMVKVQVDADFPGPMPLANSGLALYGIGGLFAANGTPAVGAAEPPKKQLDWSTKTPLQFKPTAGRHSFGLRAVIGTAPDLGFSFSSRTAIIISTPVAIRGALSANFLGQRQSLTQSNTAAAVTADGLLVISEEAITFALAAELNVPPAGYAILNIRIPVAAQFPLKGDTSNWYIHLGADGYPQQGREGGPVKATLFPKILDTGVDAYLMVRGGDIDKWPRGEGSNYNGPLIALGFGFDFVIGVKPIVWAEVFARADFLLTSNPVAFIGTGAMGGELGIGPFSIGVEASVDFMFVEKGDPWVKAEVCGTVDLFFDEIRECVTLSFNDKGTFEPPVPTCPLDHEQNHWLIDDEYRRTSGKPLGTSRAKAPTGWPDAIPLLVFSTPPDVTASDTVFKGIRNLVGAKPIGNRDLSHAWTLTSVKLFDDATNAEEAGPFSCSWQSGKFGASSERAQPVELALFTHDQNLWLNAVPDAGVSSPDKPLDRLANFCLLAPEPSPGWAVGELATGAGQPWRLPPDVISGDPLKSQVIAFVGSRIEGVGPVTRVNVAALAEPAWFYQAPQLVPCDPFEHHGRAFHHALAPAHMGTTIPHSDRRPVVIDVRFETTLKNVEVWLLLAYPADPRLQDHWENVASVDDAATWQMRRADMTPHGWRVCFATAQADGMVLHSRAGVRVAVIGVWGLTTVAEAAAQKARDAVQAAKDNAANAPPAPPNSQAEANSGGARCVLKPGRTYRIEVQMKYKTSWRWDGKDQPAREGDVQRVYYFKTAHARRSSAAVGLGAGLSSSYGRVEVFEPAMIERYLLDYEPGQSQLDWFIDDPLRVHFSRSHVAALADVYEYDLRCTVQPLEDKGTNVSPILAAHKSMYPDSAQFAKGPQKNIVDAILASPCGLKPPGAVWEAQVALRPHAWYRLFVEAVRRTGRARAALRGVSFRTSRWASPSAMFDAMGFALAGQGKATGDVELASLQLAAPVRIEGRDAEFDELLRALGVHGWLAPQAPRCSRLWAWSKNAEKWLFAGILVESPEPIHRPGRLELRPGALAVEGAAPPFNIEARDRSGSRLLYAASVPFNPPAGASLRLTATDRRSGVELSGRMQLSAPSFA